MKRFLMHITVEGTGEFPIDMLRYDRCFPRSETDSHRIQQNYFHGNCPRRQVELSAWVDRKGWVPNVARWESFSWKVLSYEVIP